MTDAFVYGHLSKHLTQISTSGIAGSANLLVWFNHKLVWKISTFNCQDLMLCDALVFWGRYHCYVWGAFLVTFKNHTLIFFSVWERPSYFWLFLVFPTNSDHSVLTASEVPLAEALEAWLTYSLHRREKAILNLSVKDLPLDLSHTGREARLWYSFHLLWPPVSSSFLFVQ